MKKNIQNTQNKPIKKTWLTVAATIFLFTFSTSIFAQVITLGSAANFVAFTTTGGNYKYR